MKLGDLMVSRAGSVKPGAFPDEEFELYSIPAHDRGGPEIARGSEIGSSKPIVRPGDVMISKIIPHIRRARIVGEANGRRQIASGEWIVFRGGEFDPNYLRHFLISDGFHAQFMKTVAGVGGSLVRARPEQVKAIEVPLPSTDEQRRIAAILDHADALRAKRRQVLAHLDTLTQSIFQDMFGDLRERSSFGTYVEEFRYGTSNKSGESGQPTLRIPNVVGGSINTGQIKTVHVTDSELNRLRLRHGDLLFVRSNGNPDNVGRCAVFESSAVSALRWPVDTWIYASYLIRARLTADLEPAFIAAYLASIPGRRQLRDRSKTSAGQYNINVDGLRTIEVPAAPIQLQMTFVHRIENLELQRTAVLAAQQTDDELFSSLQSRAFRGDL